MSNVRPQDTASPLVAGARDTSAATDLARAHMAAVVERIPEAAAFDGALWRAAIEQHLQQLPANRAWRVLTARRRLAPVSVLAPAVARRLGPPAGTRSQPTCPTRCFVTHGYDTEVA